MHEVTIKMNFIHHPYSITLTLYLTCLATGCGGELWTKLQHVLSTLESSAGRGRKLVAPYIHEDEKTQEEHITAARDTWVQATQVRFSPIPHSQETHHGSPQQRYRSFQHVTHDKR